jgi:hypothetical protein
MRPAFPADVDPALEASMARMLGHIWWSTMISWSNGMGDMTWVSQELAEAAGLLTGSLD